MKKLLSLALAMLLALGCMIPAMAETPAAEAEATAFSFTLDEYKSALDALILSSQLDVNTAWTQAEDGSTVCAIEGYPDLVVTVDADGFVNGLYIDTAITIAEQEKAVYFGQLISLSSMAALITEDFTFMLTGAQDFAPALQLLISTVTARAEMATPGESAVETKVLFGSTFTVSMGYTDATQLAMALTFSMIPGGEEETASDDAFPYALDVYKMYFDMLATNNMGITPVWTPAEDGKALTIEMTGFSPVVVSLNEAGEVTGFSAEVTANPFDSSTMTAFGQLIAMVGMSSKVSENIAFSQDQATLNAYAADLAAPLTALTERADESMAAPISSTTEVSGDTVTYTLYFDLATMQMTVGFAYEP